MEKQVYLKFENDEKLSAFLNLTIPVHNNFQTLNCTVGSNFNENEIKIAVKRFGAEVVEKPNLGE
jgi:hypothetical protein